MDNHEESRNDPRTLVMNCPDGKEDCIVDHRPGKFIPIDDPRMIRVPERDEFRRARIVGEMAGALRICAIVLKDEDVNKKGIADILRRYREEFWDSEPAPQI